MVLQSVYWVSHPRKSREWAVLLGVVGSRADRGRGQVSTADPWPCSGGRGQGSYTAVKKGDFEGLRKPENFLPLQPRKSPRRWI